MTTELANVEATAARLRAALSTGALRSGSDGYSEIFLRVTPEAVETPASAVGADEGTYATLDPAWFDGYSVTTSVGVLVETGVVVDWLDWLEGIVTVRIEGEPGAEVAEALVLSADDDRVRVPCLTDPMALSEVETSLPDRFDDDRYLGADGEPVPTVAETTVADLARLVRAVQRCPGPDHVPLSVGDGLATEVAADGVEVRARVDATVTGPPVDLRVGPELNRVCQALSGPVELQTGPGESLAVVRSDPGWTLRHVLGRI